MNREPTPEPTVELGEDLTFIPRNDTVIIQRMEVGAGAGLVRPGTARTEYELYAVVIAVGPKVENLEVGDRIIGLFSGAVPVHTTLPVYAMSEDVVVAKVEGGEGTMAAIPSEVKQGRIILPPAGTVVPAPRKL